MRRVGGNECRSTQSQLPNLKRGGTIIANTDGFDKKNLRLAGYIDLQNPLTDQSLSQYRLVEIAVTQMTRDALKDYDLGIKEKDRSKNMFVLGFICWMYNRSLDNTLDFLEDKFSKKPEIIKANEAVLRAGFNFGDTSETFTSRYDVKPAPLKKGVYRNIMGNQATAIGLIAGAQKAGLELFYGSYPITPASDILHELARHKNFKVRTFQAEDEIAAICSSIGAAFAGGMGVTASSGPGIALKGEAMGLAVMLELPLVIVNVQRGGPSTGLPTKTEQSDLMQAIHGRNGEAPMPVIAAAHPSDCFSMAYEAVRIAVEHMTPVMLLTDGYIANGSEPWRFPKADDLKVIKNQKANPDDFEHGDYLPYKRDERGVREWATPGMRKLQHRIGGLEKQDETGNVSYDPENHQRMVLLREEKVNKVADFIPEQCIEIGDDSGDLLILGWGSTYGSIRTAVRDLREEGFSVSHAQLRYIHPFPKNLGELLGKFKRVLIPELNRGQLRGMIRSEFLIDAVGLNKVKGMPLGTDEIKSAALQILNV